MERYRVGSAWRALVALAGVAMVVVGLGVLAYSGVGGGSVGAAEPRGPHGAREAPRAEAARTRESIPERIVERIRDPRAETPDAPGSKRLRLTVPGLERAENVPVYDAAKGGYERALREGALHVRGTGFPWQEGANVYIAGHRLGHPGTRSDRVFRDLDELENGDKVYLTDADGGRYAYTVFRRFVVGPGAVRVLEPVEGKSVVSLQTCTLPDYGRRLIVQAELDGTG